MNNKKDKIPFYIILKESRESEGVSLQSISDTTKINIKYLESIEKGDLDIIPSTFLRLFIKSYAKILKIDYNELLEEYEREKNITKKNIFKNLVLKSSAEKIIDKTRKPFIQKKQSILTDIKKDTSIDSINNDMEESSASKETLLSENKIEKNISKKSVERKNKLIFEDSNNNEKLKFNINESYFFKPQKIFTIIFTLISIISIYLLINYLNKTQKEKIVHINSEQNITSQNINIYDEIDDILLSSLNFDKDKFIEEKSHRLTFNINFPYVFKVVTNKKTKIYISYDDENGDRKEECNIIAKRDSLLKYKKYNNIYFDLWSAKDVQIDIENNPLSKYLGKDDVSVRGSFEPQNKLLYLKFYSH